MRSENRINHIQSIKNKVVSINLFRWGGTQAGTAMQNFSHFRNSPQL